MNSFLLTSLVGLFSGVLASMGLGGGFVLVIYLSILNTLPQQSVQGLNLFFFLPIIALSVFLHIKHKLIDVKTALSCCLFGAPFVVAGFYLSRVMDGEWLKKAFAMFIILCGLKDLLTRPKRA